MTEASPVRGHYGIDEPRWPLLTAAAGVALLSGAVWAGRRSRRWTPAPALAGVCCLGSAACYLHTTVRGKRSVWAELLRDLDLRGDEIVLDLGCGRGAVLLLAAQLVPRGRAIGIDLWRSAEQSGNRAAATRRNAELEGVADRVELHTADLRALPLPDASADLVLSSMAIHNIAGVGGRARALDETVRVLRPGGRLAIADLALVADGYAARLRAGGLEDVRVRPLGWRFWYGGPWAATSLVTAGRRP